MFKVIHLELLAPNRYESDFLNKVLYILVGQKAAKIFEVKIGGRKKGLVKTEVISTVCTVSNNEYEPLTK